MMYIRSNNEIDKKDKRLICREDLPTAFAYDAELTIR